MIFLMIMRVFFANPALEVRDIALEISHYLRPYKPILPDVGFLAPPFAAPFVFMAAVPFVFMAASLVFMGAAAFAAVIVYMGAPPLA